MTGTIIMQVPSFYTSQNNLLWSPVNQSPQAPPLLCDSQTESQYADALIAYIQKSNKKQLPSILPTYPFSYSLSYARYLKFLVQVMRGLMLSQYLKSTPFTGCQKNVILPQPKKKYTLLLDLDETLIHTKPYKYSPLCKALQIANMQLYYMHRPYLNQFLSELAQQYEIIIFTASSAEYAQKICADFSEIDAILSREYAREHSSGFLIKDLSVIKQSRNLDNVIIVDNLISCFACNLKHGIPCIEFRGETDDQELPSLATFLKEVASESERNTCSLKKTLAKKRWRPKEIPREWKELMMLQ